MLLTAILAFIQSAHAEGAATAPTGTGVSTIMQMLLPLAFFAIFTSLLSDHKAVVTKSIVK